MTEGMGNERYFPNGPQGEERTLELWSVFFDGDKKLYDRMVSPQDKVDPNDTEAARALHKRQVEALPEIIATAVKALPFLHEYAGNSEDRNASKAVLALESALQKAGVEL